MFKILPNRAKYMRAAVVCFALGLISLFFLGNTESLSVAHLAFVPAIVVKLREQRDALLLEAKGLVEDESGEPLEMDEAGEKRFDEIDAEVKKINKTIDRHILLAEHEIANRQRTGPSTQEEGERSGDGGEPAVELDESEKRAYLAYHTLQLMRGNAMGSAAIRDDAATMLVRGGHYGPAAAQMLNQGARVDNAIRSSFVQQRERMLRAVHGQEYRAAGDYYSTLVNADGAYLLPTVVVQEIEEIAKQVGVVLGLTTPYEQIVGILRVPGGSGADSKMSFVAEGGAITSRIRAFRAVELNPKKVADIIPFSVEVSVEAGPQILADMERVMGRSLGFAIDDAAFNGDGTGTYNSIDGILSSNRSGVGESVLASGEVDFDDITPDELILGLNKVPAGVRSNFTYAFHPDMKAVFKTKKDNNGTYLFNWQETSDGILMVAGVPCVFSEALPALSASAVSTTFGVGGDFRYLKVATGGGLQTEEMRTGVITDADTGADINLGTQDLRALKYRAFFDLDTNFEDAFMKFTTAAS